MIDRVKWDRAFGCDHSQHGEHLRVCVEAKCTGCGQIKFRKTLEEANVSQGKIEVTQ